MCLMNGYSSIFCLQNWGLYFGICHVNKSYFEDYNIKHPENVGMVNGNSSLACGQL